MLEVIIMLVDRYKYCSPAKAILIISKNITPVKEGYYDYLNMLYNKIYLEYLIILNKEIDRINKVIK